VPTVSGKNCKRDRAAPMSCIPPFRTTAVALGLTVKIAVFSRAGRGQGNSVASKETEELRLPPRRRAWVNIGASDLGAGAEVVDRP